MTIALWIITALLALAFLGAGILKLVRSTAQLKQSGMGWVDDFSPTAIRLISIAEIVGAIGLVVPLATGVAPVLSPIAATALAVLMIGAVRTLARRGESVVPPLVLVVLSAASAVLGFIIVA